MVKINIPWKFSKFRGIFFLHRSYKRCEVVVKIFQELSKSFYVFDSKLFFSTNKVKIQST